MDQFPYRRVQVTNALVSLIAICNCSWLGHSAAIVIFLIVVFLRAVEWSSVRCFCSVGSFSYVNCVVNFL